MPASVTEVSWDFLSTYSPNRCYREKPHCDSPDISSTKNRKNTLRRANSNTVKPSLYDRGPSRALQRKPASTRASASSQDSPSCTPEATGFAGPFPPAARPGMRLSPPLTANNTAEIRGTASQQQAAPAHLPAQLVLVAQLRAVPPLLLPRRPARHSPTRTNPSLRHLPTAVSLRTAPGGERVRMRAAGPGGGPISGRS